MLNVRYKLALQGLKAQAKAVTKSIKNKPDKTELGEAQDIMSQYSAETNHIFKLVMKNSVPISELSEDKLESWLTESA